MPLIALDAMSGDGGPKIVVAAALRSVQQHDDLSLALIGDEAKLHQILQQQNADAHPRISVQHASEVVSMNDSPAFAMRNKRDSSMRVAINMVHNRTADACVSAGNTGALMAMARFVLKMLPGVDRPAICVTMPTIKNSTHMLDLGANVDSSAEQLLQFAVMGTELVSAIENKDAPSVALLNIGVEATKGNDRIKQASTMLQESHLNYVGFVEGTDIYSGDVDVIVCDGFVGNIALKASEGVTRLLKYHANKQFRGSWYGHFVGLLAKPILERIKQTIDPRRYNGASLLGLRGIVVKSHGNADAVSFCSAIDEAMLELDKNISNRIGNRLDEILLEIGSGI